MSGSVRFADGSSIVRSETLPWTDWALPGHSFKLLSVNRGSGTWSCLMKIAPRTASPLARLHANAYAYVMDGAFIDKDGHAVETHQFSVQNGGSMRATRTGGDGALCYVMFFGGLRPLNDEGRPTGEYVDLEWSYERAKENGAAAHLPPLAFAGGMTDNSLSVNDGGRA